jgi:hypothetical protein
MPKPKVVISLHVNREYTIGVLVRTIQKGGKEILDVLSRKTGQWIRITSQQLKEQDIPTECLFAADEMPNATESSQNGRL